MGANLPQRELPWSDNRRPNRKLTRATKKKTTERNLAWENFPRDTTNQKHYPDLGSNTSTEWNFLRSDVISQMSFRGKAVVTSWNVGCFLRLQETPQQVVSHYTMSTNGFRVISCKRTIYEHSVWHVHCREAFHLKNKVLHNKILVIIFITFTS